MFSKSNLTDMLYRYSKFYKADIHKEEIQILLESSPVYPSMLSLYRTLRVFGMECSVVRTNLEDIRKLNKPFLAHLKDTKAGNVILVKKIAGSEVLWYDTVTSRFQKANTDVFLQKWDGIALYCTNEEICASSQYNKYLYAVAFILLALLSFKTIHWAVVALNILGIYCSYTLLIHETEKRNTALLNRVCKMGKHVDCDRVTRSVFSRIGNVTLADLGIAYFGMALFFSFFLLYNSSGVNISEVYSTMLICSYPFILYTLFVQLYIKKWCILCLSLDAVIVLESALFFANDGLRIPHAITPFLQILYFAPFMLSIIVLLKRYSITRGKYIEQKIHSLRIHRTPPVFKLLLGNRSIVRQDNYSLDVGKPDAPLTITTWLSPYCPYCAEIVKKMFQLIRHKKVQWKIYLTGIDAQTDNYKYHKLQLYFIHLFISDKTRFMDSIEQWYNHNRTPILKQLPRYMANDKEAGPILEKQMAYAKEIGISEFPTIFINNRRIPLEYDITNFYYMVCDDEIINILNTSKP